MDRSTLRRAVKPLGAAAAAALAACIVLRNTAALEIAGDVAFFLLAAFVALRLLDEPEQR